MGERGQAARTGLRDLGLVRSWASDRSLGWVADPGARNPRMAIRRLSELVTVFRAHLGRIQGPGLSFTRKQDLGSRSWRIPQASDGTEDSACYFTGLGRVW